jgi:hypothetical protein
LWRQSLYNTSYVFGPVTGGVAGIASIQLPSAPPAIFIGTTDVPSENVYRIISITSNTMVLRAGNGLGTVFSIQIYFIIINNLIMFKIIKMYSFLLILWTAGFLVVPIKKIYLL